MGAHARLVLACLLAIAVLAAGCGGDSKKSSSRTTGTVKETTDRPSPLPRRWHRFVNARAGFSVGLPPGWTAQGGRDASLVRSRDRALAVSISADRSDDGRRTAPASYVRRTVVGLPGYRNLRLGPVGPVRARYPAAGANATGTFARTGVRQRIVLYAIQRRGLVTYTLAFFASKRVAASRYGPLIYQMVRSFSGRAPGA